MDGEGGGRFSKCNTFLNGMRLRFFSFWRARLQVRQNIPLRGYAREFFFRVCALFFVFLCVCALVFRCLFVSSVEIAAVLIDLLVITVLKLQ
jgi:hypothetical protein